MFSVPYSQALVGSPINSVTVPDLTPGLSPGVFSLVRAAHDVGQRVVGDKIGVGAGCPLG